jgi:hypothetical protein
MQVTVHQAEKLIKGDHTFMQIGFSMMLTRLKMLYAKNPSQLTLQTCSDEINAFIGKFKGIMGADYAIIDKL